jgi:very-short-patch-repair endonuclease
MILWKRLRSRRLADLKFRRQHPIGPFVADFYCHEAGLVVEVDSAAHDGRLDRDKSRDQWMLARGIETLRVRAADVNTNLDGVLLMIRDRAIARIMAIQAKKNEKTS